jgi:hypothetical protein
MAPKPLLNFAADAAIFGRLVVFFRGRFARRNTASFFRLDLLLVMHLQTQSTTGMMVSIVGFISPIDCLIDTNTITGLPRDMRKPLFLC